MPPFKKNISRRKFIDLGVQGSTAIGLSLPIIATTGCNSQNIKTTHGACYHDCPDTCSWTATAVDNKITEFRASQDNPYTNGKLCAKMNNFPNDVTFHPDRILTPLKRVGKKGSGEFEPISWKQAMNEVAVRLKKTLAKEGGEAVLPYSYAGTEGLVQRNSISGRFFAHIGASKLERTICGNAAVAGVMTTNGQTTGVLPEDIIHSRYIILWGTNPVTSNQHLWPLIQQAREDGAKLVVIDPYQSATAVEADWHIQPTPGTDTALALAMINVIIAEDLQDQDYVDQYTVGIKELKKHVEQYDIEAVSKITGLKEETIQTLAREYASASPALIRVLIGMEHQLNGGSAFSAVAMLPSLTGAWRHFGGGLMHMTYELFGQALNWERLELEKTIANQDIRSISMIQIGRALNDSSLSPAINALFVYNSNPAVIAPNQNLVVKGLEREDLMTVVLDHFITDTARYADYVFPATSQLEHWDLLTSWGQTYLNINEPTIPPVGEAKPNTEFFRLLANEMSFTEDYLYESDLSILKKTLETDHEYLNGVTFDTLRKNGWVKLNIPDQWMPHAKGNFKTSSGKCEFYNASNEPPIPEYRPKAYSREELSTFPLKLLTIKSTKNFLNSSHANVKELMDKEGQPVLDIHPEDAKLREIVDGAEVKAYNKNGEVLLTAKVRSKVNQGVVSMPQGYWSSLVKGGSTANALTSDLLTDKGRGGALQEARVEVTLLT